MLSSPRFKLRRTAVLSTFLVLFGLVSSLEAGANADVAIPRGKIAEEDWFKGSSTPVTPEKLDRLVETQLKTASLKPGAVISDEQFVRRVWIDLTGRLPAPADVNEFLADRRSDKRARLIDKLLETEDYARHWAKYWREVIASRLDDNNRLARIFIPQFDTWMTRQIREDKSWADITKSILTASGSVKFRADDEESNGAAFFLAARRGNDAKIERAAETSRIFLGIQIQCAQCHDHPFDRWERQQFHEITAYFARVRERPFRENGKLAGIRLVSTFFGEHSMPGEDDPKKSTTVYPRFLDGEAPEGKRLSDAKRRESLAESIVSRKNPWFAAAYVNRVWGELMGQSFYQPVDDMGPERDAIMPTVLVRLSASFRGSDYDTKDLFRTILNSKTYQRQLQSGRSVDEHLLFAGSKGKRLSAEAFYASLEDTLGKLTVANRFGNRRAPYGLRINPFAFLVKEEFKYDPSARPEEIEGSISQALLLMNNPVINSKIRATGTNLLARILKSYANDDKAIKMVYLRTVARNPSEREFARCRKYISEVGDRTEAFEDILWVLINSTEYQTKR